jgi:AbrB family transcriptional regulator (stage V sporulation protein T)
MENKEMKDTGITRRIDELGRIVIPRELRKVFRIKEGDALEFYSNKEEIILKKYSPIATITEGAKTVADGIYELMEKPCVVVDKDQVVYAVGEKTKDLIGESISNQLLDAIIERKSLILSRGDGGNVLPIVDSAENVIENQIFIPVMSCGDVYGGIIVYDFDKELRFNSNDVKVVSLGASILAKKFE